MINLPKIALFAVLVGSGIVGGGVDEGPSLEGTATNESIMACLRDSDLVDNVEIVQGDAWIDPYVGGVFSEGAGFSVSVFDTPEEAAADVYQSGLDVPEGTVFELAPTENVTLGYQSELSSDELDVLEACTTES